MAAAATKQAVASSLPLSNLESNILGMLTRNPTRHYTPRGVASLLKISPVVAWTRLGTLLKKGAVGMENRNGQKSYFAAPSFAIPQTEQFSASEPNISNPPQTEAEAIPAETQALEGWRELTGTETTIINRMRERGKINGEFGRPRQVRVSFLRDKNFTIALVKAGGNLFVGEAKRNPRDPEMPTVGHDVAFTRALRNRPVKL
jgi:hypothetical protein